MIVKYLIHRPIAVIAIFFSVLAAGIYGWVKIPVNLLPSVDPPEIVIEARKNGMSSDVMERTVISRIRQSVIGSLGLEDVESKALQGFGRVSLTYEFGTNMDLALIEVNEKIDRVLPSLPPEVERPVVKKKKPTDIPLLRVHLSSDIFSITELSQLVRFEVSKRFEQLKGVAQIETNGTLQKSIQLSPKMEKIIAAGLDLNGINNLISMSNLPVGQVLVKDGNYEYLIQIENLIRDKTSLERLIVIAPSGQQIELGELFEVEESYLNPLNKHTFNNNQGIVLAIYNQPQADLFRLQRDIYKTMEQLESEFPNIRFASSQDQVGLLRDNISQLYITSGLAAFFAFVVFFISSKSKRLPLILGTVIPSSILIAIGALWVMGLTLNIITLSGFILGIGLLVDNVIILIEEINQNRNTGLPVKEACTTSVKNIFPALLSSTLTTVCVFIPLLALEGIASELFKEQAISLIIILGVSLILTFILIPTFYSLWIKKDIKDLAWISKVRAFSQRSSNTALIVIVLFLLGIGLFSVTQLKTEDLPSYSSSAFQMRVIWNEPISLEENSARIQEIIASQKASFVSIDLGINNITQNDINFFDEANIYVKTGSEKSALRLKQKLFERATSRFPRATVDIEKSANTFEMIFFDDQPLAEARIRKNDGNFFSMNDMEELNHMQEDGELNIDLNETYRISFLKNRIENSSIAYPLLVDHLKNLTDENVITSLKNPDQSIPLAINMNDLTYFIRTDSTYFDLSTFYEIKDTTEIREITADLSGPYISFTADDLESARVYGEKASQNRGWIYDLKGSLLDSSKNIERLILAGFLGIILLYLILVAQFESFSQPLIIFSLVPLAMFGSLTGLYFSGATLNIMSIIGIVVMLGIIVNDSILKIDAINRNINRGMTKSEAIKKAKDERFKPILMTSLSTILALIPILLSSGIASDLQKPFALVVIFGLIVGTWSSISILPAIYSSFIKK